MNKEALRKELEYAMDESKLITDRLSKENYKERRDTYISNRLAELDDGQEEKGLDLVKLQEKFDKFFSEESEESFNEWLKMKGYLKSPFYCQSDIEDRGICSTQCDHCKEYYKPLVDDGQEGKGLKVWRKVSEKTPNENAVYRQWWENKYPNAKTGKIEPKGEWMYFNGKINEYDEVYDDDGGVEPVDQVNVEWLDESAALPVADGEGEKATMKELVKKIFGDEAAEDKDIVDFYERVHKTAIETGNPPSLLAAATQKRDLLFDVLNSYERRIEIRAAALAFIKAYDELLDELLEIT